MARLAAGKRVRTIYLSGSSTLSTGDTPSVTLEAHTLQDDVTIIGVEVEASAQDLVDAHSNADGDILNRIGVSRAGSLAKDSQIINCVLKTVWNAAIVLGGELNKTERVMFPDGCGVEMDEGEVINLLMSASWIGGGGDLTLRGYATIYYVER